MKQNNSYRRFKTTINSFAELVFRDPVKTVSFILAFLLFFIIFFFSRESAGVKRINIEDFEIGKPAPEELIVDRDISYTDERATNIKREAESLLISPVFIKEEQISSKVLDQYETFKLNFNVLYNQGVSVENLYLKLQTILPGFFSREQVEILWSREDIQEIIIFGESLLIDFMETGVFSFTSRDYPYNERVELKTANNKSEESVSYLTKDIITLNNVDTHIDAMINSEEIPAGWRDVLLVITGVFLKENVFYDTATTEAKRTEAESRVEPVSRLLVEGERVIQKGVIVTAEDLEKIKVLGNRALTLSNYSIFGSFFYLLILFILAWILISPVFSKIRVSRTHVLIMIISMLVYFLTAMIIIRFGKFPDEIPLSLILPSSMISIMVTILINSRIGVFITIIYSLGLLLQTGMEPYSFVFALFTGIIGAIGVSNYEKRGYLIRVTGIIILTGGFTMFVIGLLKGLNFSKLLTFIGFGSLNGLSCGILAVGILPFIEHVLNAATPSRLMELSDLNTPLFKKMLVLAPGTYGHSLSVANLSESAARAIGANALLARVGAYYHDIGKIDQAEYFAENQTSGNKHDELKPTLSTTVIKTHVKIGVEKGKELSLPREVINIIDQHHGSGLISYFYIQAMKEQNGKVKPEDFSYNGIPPQSREAAIVMLADSVEAASRTLTKPNIAKLEKFIWEIIMDKIEKQQMSGCDLTFHDMEIIKKTFVQILAGHFHTRIEYPDMKTVKQNNGNGNGKK